jgi:adenylate cyclase
MILFSTGTFKALDRFLLDYKFRYLQQEDPNDEIVLVTIDERSLSHFNEQRMYWPWPRNFYQIVTDYFDSSGARLVVYDILFDTPDFDRRNLSGSMSDKRFAASLQNSNNAILSFKSTVASDSVQPTANDYPYIQALNIENKAPYQRPHILNSRPIPKFAETARSIGNTVVKPDQDGLIRSVHLFDSLAHKGFVPTLSMAAFSELKSDTISYEWTDQGLRAGDTEIPLQESGDYLINWYEKGGVQDGTFPYYSFSDVVRSAINYRRGNKSADSLLVPPDILDDKIVLVGASAAGLGDIKSTPMSSLEAFPGMEIQATILNNLIGENFITQLPNWSKVLLLLLLTFGIPFLIAYTKPVYGAASTVGVLSVIVIAGITLFVTDRIWFSTGMYFTIAFMAYSGSAAYKYFAEERQKKEIRSAFDQYVQPEFVQELIDEPEKLKLGGQQKTLTVLFTDLAGFTTISESKPPEQLVEFMNNYLGAMTDVIFEHSGTVDKYIGDAVMAFWGAPIDQNNHEILACRSTIKMLDRVDNLIPKADVHARFGIATGDMIVGNIGSHNRFNYTVLGDTVNLAARLEAANKEFGSKAMIAEETYQQVKDEFLCRQLDLLVVKGKTEPKKVYELMGDRKSEEDLSKQEEAVGIYHEALQFYYDRQWNEAIAQFQQVQKLLPGDGPSQTYIKRCKQFKEEPPGDDWDGVFHLKTK